MVAPLAAVVFVVVVQAAFLLAQRTAVQSAAHTAARVAATLGSSAARGEQSAQGVLGAHGLGTAPAVFAWHATSVSGVQFVDVTLDVPVRIAWLNETLTLRGTASAVDENDL
jgi:hypothetical protein